MYPCERVDLSFVDTAPARFQNSVELAVSPEQVFAVLAEAEPWPQWAKVITDVAWTSPEPHGVGTTRLVTMRAGMVGSEEFLAWEPNSRMAFRFNECSTRMLGAFAEDYRIVPTADGCTLTWTLAMRMNGPGRFTLGPSAPLMNMGFRWFLGNLRGLTDRRFAVSGS